MLELMGGDSVHLKDFDFSDVQEVHVDSVGDLPEPNDQGERVLRDDHAYVFHDIVVGTDVLEYGENTPIIGMHGSKSGYVNVGPGPCLKVRDQNAFAVFMYFHSPGGTVLDASGQVTDELQFEFCAFSDAAGVGSVGKLGTIDGFRVPAFKSCNFENFNAGFTFDGTPDKIFFETCPFREVSEAGVTCITLADTIEVDIVDMPSNYAKNFQPDTEMVHVESGATISDIFQYRGTTHDNTVTEENILTGDAGFDQIGYRVDGSYPIQDSGVVGELSADAVITADTSTAGADTYTILDDGATSVGGEVERVSQSSNGVLQYDGKKDATVMINASMTVVTGGDLVAASLSKNGAVQETSEMRTLSSGGNAVSLSLSGVEQLETGDTIEVQVKNITDAADFTVVNYTLTFRD